MAELINTFSWSFSAADDFDACRRKRYWGKYAMWGGWNREASETQRKAYAFTKMDNIYSLQGAAVEEAVMWLLRQKQTGRDATAEEAYEDIARPFLNNAWKESRGKKWQTDPKKYCCLREHYYGEWDPPTEKERTAAAAEHTRLCIRNFIAKVLPRVGGVRRDQEIEIAVKGRGDPESFEFNGLKVYAIPDYAYRQEAQVHIHDWKSGKPKETHRQQLFLYGLWAHTKHGVRPEDLFVYIEYLGDARVAVAQVGESDLQAIRDRISESVAEMTEYLVDGDIKRNEPVPKDEWDLAADRRICRQCNFFELCKPELEEEQGVR
ncbi:MAG: PD-(D/E)XK nuclease family protein [Kiritimatiellae bacterium]|nr:PD-(D/E)XK nuclease family protein [Kiritimatiellia bacterium]